MRYVSRDERLNEMQSIDVCAFFLDYVQQHVIQAVDDFGNTQTAEMSGELVPLSDRPLKGGRADGTVEPMKRRSQLCEDVEGCTRLAGGAQKVKRKVPTARIVNLVDNAGYKGKYSSCRRIAVLVVRARDSKQRRDGGENQLVRKRPLCGE